jgi:predicted nucleotidyltransferase
LDFLLGRQRQGEAAVEQFLRMKVVTVLGLEPRLKRFGSRVYGGQTPTSDLDVVCELPNDDISPPDARITNFLTVMHHILQQEAGCTKVIDAIGWKWTVQFCFANMAVDFTAHCGPVEEGHSPSQLTAKVASMISDLPLSLKSLIRLVVDFAKRSRVCWNKKGARGSQMKSIHWVLLVIAWWSWRFPVCKRATADLSVGEMFGLVLEHYSHFEFERYLINAFSLRWPFVEHHCATGSTNVFSIWVAVFGYERWPPNNLLNQTGPHHLVAIRAALAHGLAQLRTDPICFWGEARCRLRAYVDRDYPSSVSQMPQDESCDGWI